MNSHLRPQSHGPKLRSRTVNAHRHRHPVNESEGYGAKGGDITLEKNNPTTLPLLTINFVGTFLDDETFKIYLQPIY